MRPCYLEFCGVNSFSEPASVDFTALLEYGLFGVFGDTGSGKSTLLDCIGFALYGNVARSRSGSLAEIINYRSERAYVIFEFEIFYEGRRRHFRVERELKRKNAVQSAKVYEKEERGTVALAEGVRESNALLGKIIGLEQKDFEKCIALPQGEFAQFVKAQRSDRLKLVSRLFDLEEYGEGLVKRANARCAELSAERNVLEARLEPFAAITEEGIDELAARTEALETETAQGRTMLESAREREKRLTELNQKREEAERVEARFALLEKEEGEIVRLEGALQRLGFAENAVSAAAEVKECRRLLTLAEREREGAERALAASERALSVASAFDAERADEEIARLTGQKARAEQAALALKRAAETERRLTECRKQYAEEAERFRGFDYEGEKTALETELASLGGGDFLAFVLDRAKPFLLKEEYKTFSEELLSLRERHPGAGPDLDPLVQKYVRLSAGREVEDPRAAFEKREKARAAASQRLVELEKRNGVYRAHCQRLEQLQTEGLRLREELEEWKKSAGEPLVPEEIERELSLRKKEKRENAEARERAAAEHHRAGAALAAASERKKGAEERLTRGEARLAEALSKGGFSSEEEANALLAGLGGAREAEERIKRFRAEQAALAERRKALSLEDLPEGSGEKLAAAREEVSRLEGLQEERLRALAVGKDELARGREALQKKKVLERERAALGKRAEVAEKLKKLLEGNRFMEFVAEEYLQNVAENASKRLLSLTSGQYFLRYEGGFLVGDNLAGGKTRGVYTLSGGETFLVSLSLALALSSEICRKSLRPIEFFFLDEGFGTLDERLVDTVMDSLEKLKGEHFAIGIISHVEELKHRIERKLTIEKATEKHGSRIHA